MTENITYDIPASHDVLLPFQLEASVLRGRLVRLDTSIHTILALHDYPRPVAALLAQTAALSAALGSALKFDGVFTVQAKGDGPVRMIVADVTSDGAVRACAQYDADRLIGVPEGASLLGEGSLVFTVDQTESDERYQGIVKLEGDNLTEAFQNYFRQSEQIPTGLLVASVQDDNGVWHAACLMVQQMPREGGSSVQTDTAVQDDWHRTMALMQTCTEGELTDNALPPQDLLYRLFHEEGVRIYDAKAFRHECRCSHEKLLGILRTMPHAEIEGLAKDGQIDVKCQFCSKIYFFDLDELKAL